MHADLLLYALIAAGLIFWLRSILGTRDEDDDGQSYLENEKDPFAPPMKKTKVEEPASNVVALAGAMGHRFNLPRHIRIDNKTTENALEDIVRKYPDFDFHHFIDGAQFAFPIIIEAFAEGDKETLKEVLAEPVYEAFAKAIDERDKRGETVETQVKSVEKIDVTEAAMKGSTLLITLRYTARETCVIRDKDGKVLSGEPGRTTQMIDVWVFGRDMESDEPEWYLYETRDDEIEDHKTPVPEAGKDKD
jgi:predicted lipid-binding transport protein (Tim44 family)